MTIWVFLSSRIQHGFKKFRVEVGGQAFLNGICNDPINECPGHHTSFVRCKPFREEARIPVMAKEAFEKFLVELRID